MSLAPILAGKPFTNRSREVMFNAYKNVQRSIRDDRWKLIRYPQINRTPTLRLEE